MPPLQGNYGGNPNLGPVTPNLTREALKKAIERYVQVKVDLALAERSQKPAEETRLKREFIAASAELSRIVNNIPLP